VATALMVAGPLLIPGQ